jgi:hypothetical protein
VNRDNILPYHSDFLEIEKRNTTIYEPVLLHPPLQQSLIHGHLFHFVVQPAFIYSLQVPHAYALATSPNEVWPFNPVMGDHVIESGTSLLNPWSKDLQWPSAECRLDLFFVFFSRVLYNDSSSS